MPRKIQITTPEEAAQGLKRCKRCFKAKPSSEYRVKSTGRVNSLCNDCCDEAMALFTNHNTAGCGKHYRRHNELLRAKRRRVIAHYGNKCACCGETLYEFLAIDHENGGGNEHRRKIGVGGTTIILWLLRNNCPPGFRVLCHNCNRSLGAYGYCPHQQQHVPLALENIIDEAPGFRSDIPLHEKLKL